jgi:Putative transposase
MRCSPYLTAVILFWGRYVPNCIQQKWERESRNMLYDLLFRSVSETLMELANDPKHLGAHAGFIEILHTWGQNLMDRPHIHCVVTGGGLSTDGCHWISAGKRSFIPVKVMSALFQDKFLDYLKGSHKSGGLVFHGVIAHINEPGLLKYSGGSSII